MPTRRLLQLAAFAAANVVVVLVLSPANAARLIRIGVRPSTQIPVERDGSVEATVRSSTR